MPGSIGDTSLTEVTQVKTKLPKLQLNKFSGDPKVWNDWWIVTSAQFIIMSIFLTWKSSILCEAIRRTKLHLLLEVND